MQNTSNINKLHEQSIYLKKIDNLWYGYMKIGNSNIAIDCKNNDTLGDFVLNIEKNLEKIGIKPVFKYFIDNKSKSRFNYIQTILNKFNERN